MAEDTFAYVQGDKVLGEVRVFKEATNLPDRLFWRIDDDFYFKYASGITGDQHTIHTFMWHHALKGSNMFIGTAREISEATEISEKTVTTALKELIKRNLLKQEKRGRYMMNPEVRVYGKEDKKQALIHIYRAIGKNDVT